MDWAIKNFEKWQKANKLELFEDFLSENEDVDDCFDNWCEHLFKHK